MRLRLCPGPQAVPSLVLWLMHLPGPITSHKCLALHQTWLDTADTTYMCHIGCVLVAQCLVVSAPLAAQHQQCALSPVAHKLHKVCRVLNQEGLAVERKVELKVRAKVLQGE
jgi:ABC-type molybdate transport system permease subunit